MKKFNVTILTRHSYTLLYFQHQKKGRCSFAIFLLHLLLVLFFFLFSLFPGHLQLSFLRNKEREKDISGRVVEMREEYDIKNLNPRKNPYSKRIKKQVTINLDGDVIDYFKAQSESSGIPYQTLINLYLFLALCCFSCRN